MKGKEVGKILGKYCDTAGAGQGIYVPCRGGERLCLGPRKQNQDAKLVRL